VGSRNLDYNSEMGTTTTTVNCPVGVETRQCLFRNPKVQLRDPGVLRTTSNLIFGKGNLFLAKTPWLTVLQKMK